MTNPPRLLMPSMDKEDDMNPVFRFIDWMLRENVAFVSGLIV
ncbi:MAG: hypothetical protein RB191_20370 [Terriglobia bacterium]|nr:hypothetical protein [Terriglobia bacterium]